MNAETLDIINHAKAGDLGGHRAKSESQAKYNSEYDRATKAVGLLLSDGQWHKASKVKGICKLYNATYDRISMECDIADSENGHYVCIVNDKTPDKAPGE